MSSKSLLGGVSNVAYVQLLINRLNKSETGIFMSCVISLLPNDLFFRAYSFAAVCFHCFSINVLALAAEVNEVLQIILYFSSPFLNLAKFCQIKQIKLPHPVPIV